MKRLNKKTIRIIGILFFSALVFISNIKESNAAGVTYTRLQLQNSVLSTALTYLYNNEYSDYSQRSMDAGKKKYNVDVFWKDGKPTYVESDGDSLNKWNTTYPFRTFNQSPDSVSRANRFFIDCSSFVMSTYINAIGVDLSEYGYKNEYPNATAISYYSNYKKNYPLGKSDCLTAACDQDRINMYKASYKYFNTRILSTSSLVENAKASIKNGSPTTGITYSVNKNSSSIDNKFVVYYRQLENPDSGDIGEIKTDIQALIKPGDLIVRTKTEGTDDGGHVVLYVGNKLGDTKGIIEAKGTDMYRGSYYGDSTYGKYASGKDEYSIKYEKDYYDLFNDYADFDTMHVVVLRPINAFCSQKGNQDDAGSEVCTIQDTSSITYPTAQESISKARLRFRFQKIRREQYAMSGAYRTDGTTNDGKLLGKYNSVAPGDKITYNLALTNNASWLGTSGTASIGDDTSPKNILKVTAKVPAGTDYVANSCKGATSCSISDDNKTITWTGIKTTGTDHISYAVSIKNTTTGVVVNPGFTLYPPTDISGSLNLGNIEVNVMPTIRKLSDRSAINKAIATINSGSFRYNSDNGYANCNNSTSFNSGGFIKKVYCDSYGFNLDNYSFTGSGILNNFFKQLSSSEPYDYELNRANANTNLSKMLVPGMYGGTLLRGNDYKDSDNYTDISGNKISMNRIKYMTESDFEVGDIIVYYTFGSNATKTNPSPMSTFYMYAGHNQFVSFLSDGLTVKNNAYNAATGSGSKTISYKNTANVYTDSDANDYFVHDLYNKALFVVLRPSKMMTTVKYDFNGGTQSQSYLLFLASGKYKNLVSPSTITPPSPYTVTYEGITGATCSNCSTNNKTGQLSFKNWLAGNKEVTNSSALVDTKTHIVKAIWKGNVTLPSITKKGYKFNGWKSSANNTVYTAGTTVTLSSNATMTAQWTIENYTITYNLNGGTATNPGTYTVDTADIHLNNPTKAKYRFLGWTGSNGTTPQLNVTIPKGSTGNKSYTANFELIKHKVQFNSNGGSTVSDQSVGDGAKVSVPVTPTKDGFAFEGWYSDETLTTRYNFNTPVNAPLTLYAKWIEGKYQITYDLGGGIADNQTYYDEETESFDLGPPIRDGYEFVGWTGTNGNTPEVEVTIPKGSSGNMNYIANYDANTYTISFDVEGMADLPVQYEHELSLPTPKKEGYTFKGWFNNRELTEEFSETTMPDHDIVLYAKWQVNSYKITFNTNEGDEIPPREVEYGTDIGELTTPIKPGYQFEGWYTDKELTKEFKMDKMPAQNITIYAKWTKYPGEDVLKVPNTSKFKGILIYLISVMFITTGLGIIMYFTKKKKALKN